jgi:hypothetical protein
MEIPKRRLLDPDGNAWFAIAAIAGSMLILAYSTRFGAA